jgi:hypothetical protein
LFTIARRSAGDLGNAPDGPDRPGVRPPVGYAAAIGDADLAMKSGLEERWQTAKRLNRSHYGLCVERSIAFNGRDHCFAPSAR